MLTKQCARRNDGYVAPGAVKAISVLQTVFCCLLLFSPRPALSESIAVAINVNHVAKGEFYVLRTEQGDFLIRPDDLQVLGIAKLHSDILMLGGEAYVPIGK